MGAQFWEQLLTSPEYTADGSPLASSITLTDISPTPNLILPANLLYPGSALHVKAFGRYSTTGTPTLLVGAYYGGVAGVALAATAAITMPSGVTNMVWSLDVYAICRTIGSGGTALAIGEFKYGSTTTAASTVMVPGSAPVTASIDTTTGKAITVGAQWGTNSASNTITCHQFFAELLN